MVLNARKHENESMLARFPLYTSDWFGLHDDDLLAPRWCENVFCHVHMYME